MIRAIIFDCFGVLTTDMWRAFLDTLSSDVDKEAARDLNRAYNAGLIDMQEFASRIQEITHEASHEPENLLKEEIAKNTTLLKYIADLKPQYKIGLLSNIANNWIRDTFLTQAEQELFDTMLFSYEVGMTKPEPRMFTLVAERLRVTPDEAVMIDDIESYVQAAKAEGMQGIVYQDFEQMKRDLESLLDTQH